MLQRFVQLPRRRQDRREHLARARDLEIFTHGIARDDVQGFYTYDAFSPLVLFALERFGYCGVGEAAAFVQDGRIAAIGDVVGNYGRAPRLTADDSRGSAAAAAFELAWHQP